MTPARLWPMVVGSGALGAVAGALRSPTWQDAIEPAQVLAGVVSYPPDNPVWLYSVSTWTALHQLTAVPVAVGVPEHTLTIVISGLVGALSFIALSLTARAMGAPGWIATCVPVLIHASGAARFSPGYPGLLLGWPFTYGLVSHALLLTLLALLGLRRDRVAAFILGVFPAVHPGVGLWAWLIVGGLALLARRDASQRLRQAGWYLAAGLMFTAGSAAWHWGWITPAVVPAVDADLMRAVRSFWDTHRLPLDFTNPQVFITVLLPFVALAWQRRAGSELPSGARTLTAGLAVAVTIAVVADLAIRLSPEGLAAALALPMPNRLLVLPGLAAAAWIVGVSTASAAPAVRQTMTGWAFGGLAVFFMPPIGEWPVPIRLAMPLLELVFESWAQGAVAMLLLLGLIIALTTWLPARVSTWMDGWPRRWAPRVLAGGLSVSVAAHVGGAMLDAPVAWRAIDDRRNDAALAAAAERPGLIATAAGLHLIQAATRRPLLLDPGALDALIYVPAAATRSRLILRQVYDTDLAAPPVSWGPTGALPGDSAADVWQKRPLADWQTIGIEFGVTDVLTRSDLTLDLPVVARSPAYTLWTIPKP